MSNHYGTGAYMRVEEDPDFGMGRYVADPFQVGQASLNGLGAADRGTPRHIFKEAQDFARGKQRATPNYILRHNQARQGIGEAQTTSVTQAATAYYGSPIARVVSLAGTAAGAYHGYKRNNGSIGWGIGWGLLGGMFTIIAIPIAIAQGFGKPAKKK